MIKIAANLARMEEGRSSFKILTGKPIGKGPLRRSSRRWEDYVRMNLKEIIVKARIWVDSAQIRIIGWRL